MRVYLHRLTVTVITNIESPDAVERQIDAAGHAGCYIDARTDPDNRRTGPSVQIADAPMLPEDSNDRDGMERYYAAVDAWRDTWPRVEDFPK